MQLSNNKPFDYYAVFPHCLDNEYWPLEDLRQLVSTGGMGNENVRQHRDEWVHRELVRSLIYSPQVFVGRQSAVNDPTLLRAAEQHPDAVAKLMDDGRLVLLTMEDDFSSFLKNPPFALQAKGTTFWNSFLQANGESAVCKLRLGAEQDREVKRRFLAFFKGLNEDDDALRVLFAECTSREISELRRPEVEGEFKDFRHLVRKDLVPWAGEFSFQDFRRSLIYRNFVQMPEDGDAETIARRRRHALAVRRMADLAYNCNTPVTLKRSSFVPPGTPDPGCLPTHLFAPPFSLDLDERARQAAGQDALSAVMEARAKTKQHFFYRMQQEMTLPDIGSFTLKDVVDMHSWPEWQLFVRCEDAAMRFRDAQDLHRQLESFFEAVVTLHHRMETEMRRRTWWRRAIGGTMALGLAVVADIGCQTLLPEHAAEARTILTTTAAVAAGQTVEAGLELVIHGVSDITGKVVEMIGGRASVRRQLKLSDKDMSVLDKLADAEKATEAVTQQDRALAQAENLAMEK
ncbi:MAG: hypothetical protein K2X38_02985 [Gemmataceae bacterium]|nr:hypothetical protein [Gemmataceae bacterium]